MDCKEIIEIPKFLKAPYNPDKPQFLFPCQSPRLFWIIREELLWNYSWIDSKECGSLTHFQKLEIIFKRSKALKMVPTIESWQNWENMRDKDITYYAMYNIHFLETRLENDNKITLIITGYKKIVFYFYPSLCR
jgi:hypothetical protein